MQTDPQDTLRGLELFDRYGNNSFVKDNATAALSWMWHLPLAWYFETAMAKPMWDINAQPTLFSREFFHTWHSPPHDFSLDLYAYYQAQRQGLAASLPVKFGERAHGVSHWNVNWAAKWKFIRRTVDFSLQLKKYFGMKLIAHRRNTIVELRATDSSMASKSISAAWVTTDPTA
jgi:hypothetical protein